MAMGLRLYYPLTGRMARTSMPPRRGSRGRSEERKLSRNE